MTGNPVILFYGRLDFADANASDKMALAFFQYEVGTEAGGEDVLFQVDQVYLVPYLVRKFHKFAFRVIGVAMEV